MSVAAVADMQWGALANAITSARWFTSAYHGVIP